MWDLPYGRGASIFTSQLAVLNYYGNKAYYVFTVKYCSYSQGYKGNPYLPQGCIDIDDNNIKTHDPCVMMHLSCTNMNGSYICEDRNGKFKTRLRIIYIGIGSGLVTAIFLNLAWKSTRVTGKK